MLAPNDFRVEVSEVLNCVPDKVRVQLIGIRLETASEGCIRVNLETHRIMAGKNRLDQGRSHAGERVKYHTPSVQVPVKSTLDEHAREPGDPRHPPVHRDSLIAGEGGVAERSSIAPRGRAAVAGPLPKEEKLDRPA
jgi:hypothetical protein